MSPGRRIATALAVAMTLVLSVINLQPVVAKFPSLGLMPEVVLACPLAVIAFVVNKRPLQFFGIRRVSTRDLGAGVLAFLAALAVVVIAEPVVIYLRGASPPTPDSDILRDSPLWLGLLMSASAGVCEEFVFRGFLIEELGLLIRSRGLAAIVAALAFGFMHHHNAGWSWQMIYPGLIGAVITGLYFWRRNLPVCMLLHTMLDSLHTVIN